MLAHSVNADHQLHSPLAGTAARALSAHQVLQLREDHGVVGVEQPAAGALGEAHGERDDVDQQDLDPERGPHPARRRALWRPCSGPGHGWRPGNAGCRAR